MAEKLTPQQHMAVCDRGGKLLVSAAAGSGKTKVLVDRLMSYLMDENDPADLDEFLIITYTKAAAAELRGKIAAKLTERMAQAPENRHLQRQMQRLYLTKISTVHAFCGDILREYAYRLDIAPDFRVADENECRELRDTVMEQVLEQTYETAEQNENFRSFVDTQALGRNDSLVPQIALKVYDSARCHLDPEKWLDDCLRNAQVEALTDASETVWGKYLMEDLFSYLDLQIEAMENCAALAAMSSGMEKPAALLKDTLWQLENLRSSHTWDEIVARKSIDYGRLVISKKCPDQELGERIKAVRSACKAGLEKKLRSFADDSAQTLRDMEKSAMAVAGMVELVRQFSKEYDRQKRMRHILDFGDLEHRTLDLLLGKSRSHPTAAATEIEKRFREIMVDEYQDSNAVQDTIFSALTRTRQNCFMVGDVKQSIYQFRLADPGIFLEKYAAFAPVENALPMEGRKVLLSANFRSGGAVLAGVNDIFKECMSPNVGGLHYSEEEALREGIPHAPLGEAEVELLVLSVEESAYDEEARLVAERIEQLLDGSHFVRQGEALRPIKPEDIAILLRSPGSVGGHFRSALEARGIRCMSGGGDDLLQTQEIATLRSILQTVDNPRQDIPLIATLASPVFGFTADDLAVFRGRDRYSSVYDALLQWKDPKAEHFLEILGQLRRAAKLYPIARLIETIFRLTRMDSIYAAMSGGEARSANLQTFYQLAVDFESVSRRDLGQFLQSLEAMEEKGLIAASDQSAAGAVTMMSIHKSKGLEFPVVIVAGLSREFNRESIRAQVLCDKELGLGLTAVDERNRVRYPTIAKRAIAVKTAAESLSEEMRVLYVALTRARDRLIMTYASGNPEKDIGELASRMDMGSNELLTRDVVCPGEWVLLAALRRTEAGQLFALGGKPQKTAPGEPAWDIRVVSAPEKRQTGSTESVNDSMPEGTVERLKQGLFFRYAHSAATQAPSKQTATQRKGRDKDSEATEKAEEPRQISRSWRTASFVASQTSGTARGNATHACLQFIRYEACTDASAVTQEVRRLVQERFLTPEQGEMVDCGKIAAFFQSELGQKLRTGKHVLREFKFSILDDGENYAPDLQGEQVLLQGVVDCALIEEDGITVVDFKTDRVTKDTLTQKVNHYRQQVLTYAGAMARIYEKPVKDALLYFFDMDSFVSVTQ